MTSKSWGQNGRTSYRGKTWAPFTPPLLPVPAISPAGIDPPAEACSTAASLSTAWAEQALSTLSAPFACADVPEVHSSARFFCKKTRCLLGEQLCCWDAASWVLGMVPCSWATLLSRDLDQVTSRGPCQYQSFCIVAILYPKCLGENGLIEGARVWQDNGGTTLLWRDAEMYPQEPWQRGKTCT